jgi:hypothetical protein
MKKPFLAGRLIMAALAPTLAVATPIANVQLLNTGRPVLRDHSDFVGPYTLRLHGSNVAALCIDLKDPSEVGAHWLASLSNLKTGIASTYHPAALIQYEEEAYLLSAILKPRADRRSIQEAAWAVFDPAYRVSGQARLWLIAAQRNYATVNLADFEVISGVNTTPGCRPQEFMTELPEPQGELLVAGLLLMLAAGRRGRKFAASPDDTSPGSPAKPMPGPETNT